MIQHRFKMVVKSDGYQSSIGTMLFLHRHLEKDFRESYLLASALDTKRYLEIATWENPSISADGFISLALALEQTGFQVSFEEVQEASND